MSFKLRPYQQDIITQAIGSTKSTLIQVPTGGGKTLIAKEIALELVNKGLQVLFVAPKIILMDQTAKVFKDLNPHIVHGINEYNQNHHVLISTIQTASRRDINPDVIFVDEIHYGFDGKMLQKLIKDKLGTRIIGLSATPFDKNGKQLEGFDLVLDQYDLKYMVENQYLVNMKSYVLTKIRKLDEVQVIAGDYNLKELSKIVSDNQTILEIVQSTAEYIFEYKKTIVFAVDINHAELLTQAYQHEGFSVAVLHSKLSKDQIDANIRLFREGQIKILVSVLMLTTGFDVPDTDVAVIARPTQSQNLYKQMVGRVLRIADGKTHSVLLDCANVIENLGMPLDPIKIIENHENSSNKQKCTLCGSENLSLRKNDNESCWYCKDCGHKKAIENGAYKCILCNTLYTHDAQFEYKNNKLYLVCKKCPYPTLISEFTGDEKFVQVEKNEYKNTFLSNKSLGAIFEERKEKAKAKKKALEEEKNNKKMLNMFEEKMIKRFKSQYLSLNQNKRKDIVELRHYVQSETLVDRYNKMKSKLINQNEGYFDIPYIVDISKTSEFFKKLVISFHSNFLNYLYQDKINTYLVNTLSETLKMEPEDFILKFNIPENECYKIIELENEFLQTLEDEEKLLIVKLDTVNADFFVKSGSYKISIEIKSYREKVVDRDKEGH